MLSSCHRDCYNHLDIFDRTISCYYVVTIVVTNCFALLFMLSSCHRDCCSHLDHQCSNHFLLLMLLRLFSPVDSPCDSCWRHVIAIVAITLTIIVAITFRRPQALLCLKAVGVRLANPTGCRPARHRLRPSTCSTRCATCGEFMRLTSWQGPKCLPI